MRIAFLALACAAAGPAAAVTLTFDSPTIADDTQILTIGDFTFGNFIAKNTVGFYPSGYVNGVVSHDNVAYNGGGRSASIASATPFSLTSGYVAGAWNDGLTVTLIGTLAGARVFTQSFVVDTQSPQFTAFNPGLIDKVVFSSVGGVQHVGYYDGVGTQFALDDLTINGTLPPTGVVPEPAAWAMFVAGFGLVGAMRRRTRRIVAA